MATTAANASAMTMVGGADSTITAANNRKARHHPSDAPNETNSTEDFGPAAGSGAGEKRAIG